MIYAIGDLHLDSSNGKPMDIFGVKWENHGERIMENWRQIVSKGDLVLVPGDISWALKLDEAYMDLKKIDKLPGLKVFVKGNHDYWWQSLKKMKSLNLNTINFIQNNSYIYKNIGICGTRGWLSKDNESFKEDDERIFNRELQRLEFSLNSLENEVEKKVVIIHYPPFNIDNSPNEFVDIMKDHGVDICIYGHLHGEGHKYVIEGNISGIDFHCVACDFIDFKLKKILESD